MLFYQLWLIDAEPFNQQGGLLWVKVIAVPGEEKFSGVPTARKGRGKQKKQKKR
jgi:hypothetical protein